MIRRVTTALAFLAVAMLASTAFADTSVTIDPAKLNLGFMNVFNLPVPAGDGAFQFASGWGFGDLNASYSGSTLTFTPNTIGDPDPYWYKGGGGMGHPGNKQMEANGYAEDNSGALSGVNVRFSGQVLSNTLTAAHTIVAFIKDFAPDFSSFNESHVSLPLSGPFTLTLATNPASGRHVQYGFQMVGPDVWVTDIAAFGKVVMSPYLPVPTKPTTWGRVKALYR